MNAKSLLQLLIFLVILGLWYKIAWPLQDKVSIAVGALGGILLHWALTNKGNRNIINIRPFSAGWRVLLYDMLLLSFLFALLKQSNFALLEAFKNNVQNVVLTLSLVGAIGLDYGVEGGGMRKVSIIIALLVVLAAVSVQIGEVSALEVVDLSEAVLYNGAEYVNGGLSLPPNNAYAVINFTIPATYFEIHYSFGDPNGYGRMSFGFKFIDESGAGIGISFHGDNDGRSPWRYHLYLINIDGSKSLLESKDWNTTNKEVMLTVEFSGNHVIVKDILNNVTYSNYTLPTVVTGKIKSLTIGQHLLAGDWAWAVTSLYIYSIKVRYNTAPITINIKDALTNQPLDNVVVKEGDQVLGTINSGDSIELPKGTHTLTFEKSGYWSVTKTIDVQSDMTVEVEMYPSSAAVMIEAPSNITTFENTLTEVKLQIEPIAQEATKNAYLSVSGITPLEVRKGASIISSENGKYYLGDISSLTEITIKFKAGTPGTKTFSVTITSQDALGTKTYEATKQIVYTVKQLPFQVQLPSTWSVGENEVRINEASGQQVLITLSLLDPNGTEIWSDSYTFGPYEGHAFTVNIPAEGDYTLKVSWNGYTAVWSIKVNPAVSILTDTVNVGKGDIGTIKVKIRNPTSRTQYYTVVLEGGFIEGNVTKQIAVAPLSEKTIDIAFSVPKDVQFDAYDLTLRVLQGNATTYQGLVHVIIEDTGFSLPLGGEGPLGLPLWMWGVLGVVALLLIVREVRR
ncbi:peptidase associated/transthyretin-like domain-containing protein [Thermococcus chitonophagus]|uniref:Hypothetical membrane protein, conserved n=1 Tax=Thermococcus chitonophagus TaxID=54262 RepID=A0A160VSZ3_9EURY|nr:hypothetical protein [Thermococcus chitonophagus]CUX78207.1 hypothetical membrane protein, conserved [Thermococcus chitonophagus]